MCPCLDQSHDQKVVKHYLIMSQVEGQNNLGGVEMFFNQVIEFSEVEDRPGVVFLNLFSQIDFNVYQYLQNSMEMNLQFVEEVGSIVVLCH